MCFWFDLSVIFHLLYTYKIIFTVIYNVITDKLSALFSISADNLQMILRYYMIEWCFFLVHNHHMTFLFG